MSNDEPYDFIDPEQYERKKAVQRAVEAKEGRQHSEDLSGTSNKTFGRSILTPEEVEEPDVDAEEIVEELEESSGKESGKGGDGSPDSPGMIHRIKTAVGGFFF